MQADNCRRVRRIAGVSEKTAGFFVASARGRRVLFHVLRCLILMVAGIWACLAGSFASAQTPITLVSNLAQTVDAPQFEGEILRAWGNQDLGIVFRTGPSQSGALLSAVTLDVNRWPRGTTPTVSIYRAELIGAPGLPAPTTRIATLENPWAAMGWRTFTVSSRVQLKPNRFYAIVVESTATTAQRAFELRGTQSYDEDAGSQTGWDIERITNVDLGMGWEGNDASASTQKVRFAAHGYDAGEVWREGAKLESLTVTPVSGSVAQFTPSFRPGRRGPYTVWVTHDTSQVTLEAVAESSSARVEMPDDVNPGVEGTQINVPAGTATEHEIRVIDGPSGIFRTFYRLRFKHPGSTLTGRLEPLEPVSSDGSLRYRFAFKLSAPVELSPADLRSFVFALSNGAILETPRPVGQAVGPGGNPLSRTWHLTVTPIDAAAHTRVTFRHKSSCASSGAVCTVGGLKLDSMESLTFSPSDVRGVSIEDASADEQDGEIVFNVSLSKPAQRYVYVDFETIDSGSDTGTATPGADYRPQSTRLVIPPGITSVEAGVALIDDSVNDDGETVKVRLSNARQVDDRGVFLKPVTIRAAEATGTIRNADAMPKVWLSRFGRTVADQVIDAVESRLRPARSPGANVSLAGQRIGSDPAQAVDEAQVGHETLAAWLPGDGAEVGLADARAFRSRAVSGRDFLTGSSFALAGGSEEGGFGSLWGRGAIASLGGREGELTVDGEVQSALLGADWSQGSGLAGLAVGHSRGEGEYRAPGGEGEVVSTLTGFYPYGRLALNERLSMWGIAGYGSGTMRLLPEHTTAIETDMELAMGALGLRGIVVRAPAEGGVELAATTDGMAVRTSTGAVHGSGGTLAAATADVTRLRLGLEVAWRGPAPGGTSLAPVLRLGMRHDGGDAETGFGADIGGGLSWSIAEHGIEVDVRGRTLLTHADGDFREYGIAGSVVWDPAPGSARGPSLALRQTLGASATGGADALLDRTHIVGLAATDDSDALDRRRFEAKLGYAFAMFGGRFVGTPEIGFGRSESSRDMSLGWRLGLPRHDRTGFDFGVEATRTEALDNDRAPMHAIGLRSTVRW